MDFQIVSGCEGIGMAGERARLFPRRRCRGGILVSRLSGGPSLKGILTDLSGGGARLILDRPLGRGEVVRLVFPRKGNAASQPGRIILGQVVHSQIEPGCHIVRVAFAWDAAVKQSPRAIAPKRGLFSWFRGFWQKSALRRPVSSQRRQAPL